MDPVLQRIGDVTIQRLAPKPKESQPIKDVLPPPNPETTDKTESEEEEEEEDDEVKDNPGPETALLPPPTPQSQNMKRTIEFGDDIEILGKKTKVDFSDVIDNKKITINKKNLLQQIHQQPSSHIDSEDEISEYDSECDTEEEEEDCDDINKKLTDVLENLVKGPLDVTAVPTSSSAVSSDTASESQDDKLKESEAETSDYDYDITEKLKEMGEISFETVKKVDKPKKNELGTSESEISVTAVKKKESGENEDDKANSEKKTPMNMRKNIREVMDETQLDESTLAAQRQEAERLRRVQEQQRLIRDLQRQVMQSRVHEKVFSVLQGRGAYGKPVPGK